MVPEGDHVAIIGENRKMLIFPLDEVPEMARGKGVRLQKYKDGGLTDVRAFRLKDGLTWTDSSGRNFVVTELEEWIGERAQAGRLPPKGFPHATSSAERRSLTSYSPGSSRRSIFHHAVPFARLGRAIHLGDRAK